MKVNYHTHTPHCGHALGTSTKEYADAAYNDKIDILGFSDHAPFKDHDFGCRMPFSDLEIYFNEVDELQNFYKGKMKILKSLEIEYLPEFAKENNYYEWLLNEKKLDYLLLGEHFFRARNNEMYNLYSIPDKELVIDYALACREAFSTGYFKILAHPDLFGVNPYPWDKTYDEAADIIIDSAIKYNIILEYNANGYRRGLHDYPEGKRYMYPLSKFWDKVKGTNVSVVVGSDSHNPAEIWDYAMPKAYDYLKQIGITPIETF